MAWQTITADQVDAKSPIDEQLMEAIRENLIDLDSRQQQVGIFDHQWKLNGYLNNIPTNKYARFDGALVSKSSTLQKCSIWLAEPGNGGTLEVDVRRYTKPDAAISSILRQFSSAINTISRAGTANTTQSVTRATSQISTQSIALWKSALNITSIIPLGSDYALGENLVRYNLGSDPGAGWEVGDPVTSASAVNGADNGDFNIIAKNVDGGFNIIIRNASAVGQSSTTGTVTLRAYLYTFTNPVSTQFAAGEVATFAGHTSINNDGPLLVYAINQGGNNIVIKNVTGTAQGSPAGTADANRWIYAFSSAALTSDYVVGEKANATSHAGGGNNGDFPITAVNSGGNNIIVYNLSGVVQGSSGGSVNSNRFVYYFSVDPSSSVTVGDYITAANTTSGLNSGEFQVKIVNRTTSDNVVIYNAAGGPQGGAAGTVYSKKVIVKFSAVQSDITTDSRVTIFGSPVLFADGDYDVKQINRGGGSNYNAVVEIAGVVESLGHSGRVVLEGKSIFDTRPTIVIPPQTSGFSASHSQVSSNGVLNATRKIIPADTLLMADIVSIPTGRPKNIIIQIL